MGIESVSRNLWIDFQTFLCYTDLIHRSDGLRSAREDFPGPRRWGEKHLESSEYERTPEISGCIYHKILRVERVDGRCSVWRADTGAWCPAEDCGVGMDPALGSVICPDDQEKVFSMLSLDRLREQAVGIMDFGEESCLYRLQGEPVRWVEQRVIYCRRGDKVLVNILGQDVTERKSREESRLQALEERAQIISSLSSLFFSTYYIDLLHDSFRAVIQLRRVEDVLGEEVNCTAALKIYANHFIHPDDREEYLRTMNVQNLRNTLRWWKPCAAVEYRRLPEDPAAGQTGCCWVRASAVLAQTDADDMPRTVVYVAQDISGNRRGTGDVG